jgi:hypothetical protein
MRKIPKKMRKLKRKRRLSRMRKVKAHSRRRRNRLQKKKLARNINTYTAKEKGSWRWTFSRRVSCQVQHW